MKETNRMKLYDYCKRYVRIVETKQYLVILDQNSYLEKHYDTLNDCLSKLEQAILETVNNGDVDD